MRILALETTEKVGSVAALEDDRLIVERSLPAAQRSAQALAPVIRDVLGEAGWNPAEVELVAVASGPGSFTGLRIGVTTAKAFAYASGAEVLGVGTLDAVAWRASGEWPSLEVAMYAERGEVFAARYERAKDNTWQMAGAFEILTADDWLARLAAPGAVSGPALTRLAARIPGGVNVLDESLWAPTAGAVGQVGWREYQAGRRDDVWQLVPDYFRKSAAEEKR